MKILNNLKKNAILLVIITIIVLYFVLRDDFEGIVEAIKNMDIKYILLAFLFYAIYVVLKGYINYRIIRDPKKISVKKAISQNVIAQFFNGITPFQTGGEPMAIYMLTEEGIPVSKATHYMVQSFIFYQIALVMCGFFAVSYNYVFRIFPKVQFLQHLVILWFLINIGVVILLLISYSKPLTDKLCNLTIKICKKFKIKIKEKELEKKFAEYHNGFKELTGRKRLLLFGVVTNMISLLCLYSVPYFILHGMGIGDKMTFVETIVSSAYVYLIGAFVPIPGASGGIEYGFTQFFGNFMEGSIISAMLIVWRFITYYLGVIIGGIVFNIRERVKKWE